MAVRYEGNHSLFFVFQERGLYNNTFFTDAKVIRKVSTRIVILVPGHV